MISANRLEYRELYKHFDGLVVFNDVTFGVPPGRITALIGPNGAGKSTLINMTCGVFPPDGGTIFKDGHDLRALTAPRALGLSLARTFQNVRVFSTLSVLEMRRLVRRLRVAMRGDGCGNSDS